MSTENMTQIARDNQAKLIFASMGNLSEVKKLLAAGVKANVYYESITPLHIAAMCTNPEVTAVLISAGADVTACDGETCTPLHIAARYNNPAIVKTLIAHGADIGNISHGAISNLDHIDFTPLHFAAKFNSKEAVAMLIQLGAKINNAEGNEDATPLHIAAKFNKPEMVKMLIELGADVNKRDYSGYTPLHFATSFGSIDVVPMLIELGADVEATNYLHQTPLSFAAYNDQFEMVVQILKGYYKGMDVRYDAIFQYHAAQIIGAAQANEDIHVLTSLLQPFHEQIQQHRGQFTVVASRAEKATLAALLEEAENTTLAALLEKIDKATLAALLEDADLAALLEEPALAALLEKATLSDVHDIELTAPVFVQASQVYGANTATDPDTSTTASTRTVYVQMDLAIDFEVDFIGE